jgi:hypothetical protein
MSIFINQCIQNYFDSSSGFYGESSFKDKDEIKRLAAFAENPRDRLYDPGRKLWGTRSFICVRRLIESGLWYPIGVDRNWKSQFMAELHERINDSGALASKRAIAKSEQLRNESMAQSGVDANGNKVLNAEERTKIQQERDRGVCPNDPREIELLQSIGFGVELLQSIPPLADSILGMGTALGPSSGISLAGKVLRMIRHRHAAIRSEFACDYSDSGAELYFDTGFLKKKYDTSDKELVAYLQKLADTHGGVVPSDTASTKKGPPKKASALDAVIKDDLGGKAVNSVVYGTTDGDKATENQCTTTTTTTSGGPLLLHPTDCAPNEAIDETVCLKCGTVITEQFLECSCCTPDVSKWERCYECERGLRLTNAGVMLRADPRSIQWRAIPAVYVNRKLQPCIHTLNAEDDAEDDAEDSVPNGYSLPGLEGVSMELQATAICDSGANFVEDVIRGVEEQLEITLPLDAKEPRLEKEIGSTSGACAENAMAEQLSHVPAWVPCGVKQPARKKRATVAAQSEAVKKKKSV